MGSIKPDPINVEIESFGTTVPTVFRRPKDGRNSANHLTGLKTPTALDDQYLINRLMTRVKL